jgi:hypothetical protein
MISCVNIRDLESKEEGDALERRTGMSPTRRTALPLGLLAITFFLPMAQACNEVVSPLSYISDFTTGLWLAPTFATAAILAVAVWRSWRGAPRTASAFWATAALVFTMPIMTVLFVRSNWFEGSMYGVAGVASLLLLLRARRAKEEEKLTALLDTYVVAVLPLATVILMAGKYFGAHLFVAAYATLVAQRLFAFGERLLAVRKVGAAAPIVNVRVAPTPSADVGVMMQARVDEDLARFDEMLDEYVERKTMKLGG